MNGHRRIQATAGAGEVTGSGGHGGRGGADWPCRGLAIRRRCGTADTSDLWTPSRVQLGDTAGLKTCATNAGCASGSPGCSVLRKRRGAIASRRTPKTLRDFSCGGRIPRGLGVRQSSAAFGDGTGFDRRRPSRLLSPDPSGRGLPHSSVCSAPRCRPARPTNSSAPGASCPWSPSPPASVISSSCSTASSKIPPPSLLTEHRCCRVAELHSAGRRQVPTRSPAAAPADPRSAIRQNPTLRYISRPVRHFRPLTPPDPDSPRHQAKPAHGIPWAGFVVFGSDRAAVRASRGVRPWRSVAAARRAGSRRAGSNRSRWAYRSGSGRPRSRPCRPCG